MKHRNLIRSLLAALLAITGSLQVGWPSLTQRPGTSIPSEAASIHALVRQCSVDCTDTRARATAATSAMFPRRSDGITRLLLMRHRRVSITSASTMPAGTPAVDR